VWKLSKDGSIARRKRLCDVRPRDTETFREFEQLMGSPRRGCGGSEPSAVLVTLEHVCAAYALHMPCIFAAYRSCAPCAWFPRGRRAAW
jgi:hypothetical protein